MSLCTKDKCECQAVETPFRCVTCGKHAPDQCSIYALRRQSDLSGWAVCMFPFPPRDGSSMFSYKEATKLCPDCGARAMLLIREMNAPRAIGHTKNKRFL